SSCSRRSSRGSRGEYFRRVETLDIRCNVRSRIYGTVWFGWVVADELVQRQLPPGPKIPALVQGLAYLLAGERFIDHCTDRYGDAFTLRITGLGRIVVLLDPATIKTVFTAGRDVLDA